MKKLSGIADYAVNRTRFYAGRIDPSASLAEMPFTMPKDLVTDPLAFLAIPQNEVVRVTTLANSGTTAMRKRVFYSSGDIENTINFFAVGMSTMTRPGDRACIMISNPTENSLGSMLRTSLSGIGVKATIAPAIRSVNEALEAAHGADCLIGLPGEMLYICHTEPRLKPRSVLLAGDIVPGPVADVIREIWQCDVYLHYGHSEFGYGCAVDCAHHNGLHTRDADLIFEVIDPVTGKPTVPGEKGEIVITTLTQSAIPLIRYKTGNLSRLIDTTCGCGGKVHRISAIEGRVSNNIPVGNGRNLNICQLDNLLFSNRSVKGFNASLRNEEGRITLVLLIESKDKIKPALLREVVFQDINIEVSYGNADPFRQRGKRRIKEL
ncbi:MAG: phenylacetate--CoA ligase family protein [Bacteroidales bacterium]|nr:phenylacetate--CoA ligase family protein [Bacteroidales bacterium]